MTTNVSSTSQRCLVDWTPKEERLAIRHAQLEQFRKNHALSSLYAELKDSTLQNALNLRYAFNLLADRWGRNVHSSIGKLEGNSSEQIRLTLEFNKHLLAFLEKAKAHFLERDSLRRYQALLEQYYELYIEIEKSQTSADIQTFIDKLRGKISSLQVGEELFVPIGWTGLMPLLGFEENEGHAMSVLIRKTDEGYLFYVLNSGRGSEAFKTFEEGYKQKVQISLAWKELSYEEIANPFLWKALIEPIIVPRVFQDRRPFYTQDHIANALKEYLPSEKKWKETPALFSFTTQRAGTCSQKSQNQIARIELGDLFYKRYIALLKLTALVNLVENYPHVKLSINFYDRILFIEIASRAVETLAVHLNDLYTGANEKDKAFLDSLILTLGEVRERNLNYEKELTDNAVPGDIFGFEWLKKPLNVSKSPSDAAAQISLNAQKERELSKEGLGYFYKGALYPLEMLRADSSSELFSSLQKIHENLTRNSDLSGLDLITYLSESVFARLPHANSPFWEGLNKDQTEVLAKLLFDLAERFYNQGCFLEKMELEQAIYLWKVFSILALNLKKIGYFPEDASFFSEPFQKFISSRKFSPCSTSLFEEAKAINNAFGKRDAQNSRSFFDYRPDEGEIIKKETINTAPEFLWFSKFFIGERPTKVLDFFACDEHHEYSGKSTKKALEKAPGVSLYLKLRVVALMAQKALTGLDKGGKFSRNEHFRSAVFPPASYLSIREDYFSETYKIKFYDGYEPDAPLSSLYISTSYDPSEPVHSFITSYLNSEEMSQAEIKKEVLKQKGAGAEFSLEMAALIKDLVSRKTEHHKTLLLDFFERFPSLLNAHAWQAFFNILLFANSELGEEAKKEPLLLTRYCKFFTKHLLDNLQVFKEANFQELEKSLFLFRQLALVNRAAPGSKAVEMLLGELQIKLLERIESKDKNAHLLAQMLFSSFGKELPAIEKTRLLSCLPLLGKGSISGDFDRLFEMDIRKFLHHLAFSLSEEEKLAVFKSYAPDTSAPICSSSDLMKEVMKNYLEIELQTAHLSLINGRMDFYYREHGSHHPELLKQEQECKMRRDGFLDRNRIIENQFIENVSGNILDHFPYLSVLSSDKSTAQVNFFNGKYIRNGVSGSGKLPDRFLLDDKFKPLAQFISRSVTVQGNYFKIKNCPEISFYDGAYPEAFIEKEGVRYWLITPMKRNQATAHGWICNSWLSAWISENPKVPSILFTSNGSLSENPQILYVQGPEGKIVHPDLFFNNKESPYQGLHLADPSDPLVAGHLSILKGLSPNMQALVWADAQNAVQRIEFPFAYKNRPWTVFVRDQEGEFILEGNPQYRIVDPKNLLSLKGYPYFLLLEDRANRAYPFKILVNPAKAALLREKYFNPQFEIDLSKHSPAIYNCENRLEEYAVSPKGEIIPGSLRAALYLFYQWHLEGGDSEPLYARCISLDRAYTEKEIEILFWIFTSAQEKPDRSLLSSKNKLLAFYLARENLARFPKIFKEPDKKMEEIYRFFSFAEGKATLKKLSPELENYLDRRKSFLNQSCRAVLPQEIEWKLLWDYCSCCSIVEKINKIPPALKKRYVELTEDLFLADRKAVKEGESLEAKRPEKVYKYYENAKFISDPLVQALYGNQFASSNGDFLTWTAYPLEMTFRHLYEIARNGSELQKRELRVSLIGKKMMNERRGLVQLSTSPSSYYQILFGLLWNILDEELESKPTPPNLPPYDLNIPDHRKIVLTQEFFRACEKFRIELKKLRFNAIKPVTLNPNHASTSNNIAPKKLPYIQEYERGIEKVHREILDEFFNSYSIDFNISKMSIDSLIKRLKYERDPQVKQKEAELLAKLEEASNLILKLKHGLHLQEEVRASLPDHLNKATFGTIKRLELSTKKPQTAKEFIQSDGSGVILEEGNFTKISNSLEKLKITLWNNLNEKKENILRLANALPADKGKASERLLKNFSEHQKTNLIKDLALYFLQGREESWFAQMGLGQELQKEILKELVEYKLAESELQKAERVSRLIDSFKSKSLDDPKLEGFLLKEIAQEIGQELAYVPDKDYHYLFMETFLNIRFYKEQIAFIDAFSSNLEGCHKVAQLTMGSGKSKYLLPFIAFLAANGENFSMVVVPDSLYNTFLQDLRNFSLDHLNRPVHGFSFAPENCNERELNLLLDFIRGCIRNGEVVVAKPKDLQTLNLMYDVRNEEIFQIIKEWKSFAHEQIEKFPFSNEQKENFIKCSTDLSEEGYKKFTKANFSKVHSFLESLEKKHKEVYKTLKKFKLERDLLREALNLSNKKLVARFDEFDSLFHRRQQLTIPMSMPKALPQEGIDLSTLIYYEWLPQLQSLGIENNEQTLIKTDKYEKEVVPFVCDKAWETFGQQLKNIGIDKEGFIAYATYDYKKAKGLSQDYGKASKVYRILDKKKGEEKYQKLADRAAFIKRCIAKELQETLESGGGEKYIRSEKFPKQEVMIPAHYGQPSEGSIFRNPWETVFKSCQYYRHTWKDPMQTKNMMLLVVENAFLPHPDPLLEQACRKVFHKNPLDLDTNDPNSIEMATAELSQLLKQNDSEALYLVKSYLGQKVLRKQTENFPLQMTNNPQDLGSIPVTAQGCSGTMNGKNSWPLKIQRPAESNSDQEFISTLNAAGNQTCLEISSKMPKQIIQELVGKNSQIFDDASALIDLGFLFRGYASYADLALDFLEGFKEAGIEKSAVLTWAKNSKGELQLALFVRGSRKAEWLEGSDSKKIETAIFSRFGKNKVLTIYPYPLVVGGDIPLPPFTRGLVTYGEQTEKDLHLQATGRMRKLLKKGQFITYLLYDKVKEKLSERIEISQPLTGSDLLRSSLLYQESKSERENLQGIYDQMLFAAKDHIRSQMLGRADCDALYEKARSLFINVEERSLFEQFGPLETVEPKDLFLENLIKKILASIDPSLNEDLSEIEKKLNAILTYHEKNKTPLPESISSKDAHPPEAEMEVAEHKRTLLEGWMLPFAEDEMLVNQEKRHQHIEKLSAENEEMEVHRIATQKTEQQEEAEQVFERFDPVKEKKWPAFPELLTLPFRKVEPFLSELQDYPAVYQVGEALGKIFDGAYTSLFSENLCITENLCRTLFDPSKEIDIFERSGKLIYHMLVIEDEGKPRKYILCSLGDSDAFTRALSERQAIPGRKIWLVETYGELVQSGKDPWIEPSPSEMGPFIEAMVLKGDMMHLIKYPIAFKAWLGEGATREQKLEFIEKRLEPLDEEMQEFKQRFLALVKSRV